MNPLEFIVFFMLLALVSSIFIVSFYNVTRYYIEVQPDGKEVVKGYIGKWYSYFIEKIVRYGKRYYSNNALEHKLSELIKMLPQIGNKFMYTGANERICLFTPIDKEITDEEYYKIETVLSCKLLKKNNADGAFWFIYIEEPIYLFPEWIRKPLSQCVVCMASVFGSIIWLFINHVCTLFSWATHPTACFYGFWLIFILVISKINDYFYLK